MKLIRSLPEKAVTARMPPQVLLEATGKKTRQRTPSGMGRRVAPAVILGQLFIPAGRRSERRWTTRSGTSRRILASSASALASCGCRAQVPYPHQVVRGERKGEDPIDHRQTAVPGPPDHSDRFQPPEDLLALRVDPLLSSYSQGAKAGSPLYRDNPSSPTYVLRLDRPPS
jgi:hypothetical protein